MEAAPSQNPAGWVLAPALHFSSWRTSGQPSQPSGGFLTYKVKGTEGQIQSPCQLCLLFRSQPPGHTECMVITHC